MREIIFRGKRTDNGGWVYGYLYITQNGKYEISNYCKYYNYERDTYIVIPETVGQYTGLKDKNGKKIFEGDIFKFDDEVWESYETSCGTEYNSYDGENYGVVGYNEDLASYDFVKYKYNESQVEADLHENHDIEFAYFIDELEVIGNIHDNPELLEVEE